MRNEDFESQISIRRRRKKEPKSQSPPLLEYTQLNATQNALKLRSLLAFPFPKPNEPYIKEILSKY